MKRPISIILLCVFIFFPFLSVTAKSIKIAGILAETGIAAGNNLPFIQVLKIGVDEINSRGGLLGHKLELLMIDNKSTPIGSKLAAEKAVSLDVTAVIGAAWSSHSLQIAPVLQRAKIPMITGSSTHPKVTRYGDYIFRTCFIDSFQAKAMAQFARSDLDADTTVVLEMVNEDFSITLVDLFIKSFQAYQGKVLARESYYNKTVNFSDLIEKMTLLKPDVVYIPGYGRDSGLLIKQAAAMGLQTTFLGADGWGGSRIYEFGKESLNGHFQSAHWHHGVHFSASNYLKKIYKEKYAREIPHLNAPLFYDAVMVLADAIQRAGTIKRSAIRDALAKTIDFQGATGNITFDQNGDPLNKPVVILKFGKTGPTYFKTIQP